MCFNLQHILSGERAASFYQLPNVGGCTTANARKLALTAGNVDRLQQSRMHRTDAFEFIRHALCIENYASAVDSNLWDRND